MTCGSHFSVRKSRSGVATKELDYGLLQIGPSPTNASCRRRLDSCLYTKVPNGSTSTNSASLVLTVFGRPYI